MITIDFDEARTIQGADAVTSGPTLTSVPITVAASGTMHEALGLQLMSTVAEHAEIATRISGLGDTDTVSVLTPGDVIERGVLYGPPGEHRLYISSPKGARIVTFSTAFAVPEVVDTALGYGHGTCGAHIMQAFGAGMSGKTAGDSSQLRYSAATYSSTLPSATPNPQVIMGGYSLAASSFARYAASGVAVYATCPWRSPVHLIAPRFAIAAYHVRPAVGEIVQFRRDDGSFVAATVIAVNDTYAAKDISICTLSTAISGVNPYRLLPAGWAAALPSFLRSEDMFSLPTFSAGLRVKAGSGTDSTDRLKVVFGHVTGERITNNAITDMSELPANMAWMAPWYNGVDSGDSGNGVFLPLNGEAVLLGTQHTAAAGPFLAYYSDWINSVVGGAARFADLSTFRALG